MAYAYLHVHMFTSIYTCSIIYLQTYLCILYITFTFTFTYHIFVYTRSFLIHPLVYLCTYVWYQPTWKGTCNECCDGVYLLNLDSEFIQIWTTFQYPRPLSLSTHYVFQIAWVNPVLYCMFHLIFALNFHDLGTGLPATTQAAQRVIPGKYLGILREGIMLAADHFI